MLKFPLIHPEILDALGRSGHLSTVLISDANYPHGTRTNPNARKVWANFAPGVVDGVTLLRLIVSAVPVEAVHLMEPERSGAYAMHTDPPIWQQYQSVLQTAGFSGNIQALQKPQFNEMARSDDLCLVIASGETGIFANVLLTIGVVRA